MAWYRLILGKPLVLPAVLNGGPRQPPGNVIK